MAQAVHSLVQSMQTQWQRHEVLANNLANVSTPAFKRDDLALVHDTSGAAASANLLQLPSGGSVMQWTDFSQGAVRTTGRELDAAINGPGFFVVETPAGERYTRAGAFNISREGFLVTPTGEKLIGQRGPIPVGSGRITFGAGGEVVDNGRVVDTLRVVDLPRPYRLLKEGNGIYAPVDPKIVPEAAKAFEIAGGALESSNVQTVEAMISMIEVLRTYEAAQRAMQAVEEANHRATTDIGKVS